MKGIGILLMLIGHVPFGFHLIYSFHMPLFFIIAGVFSKPIYNKEDLIVTIKKDFSRLILPMIVTMLCVIALSPLHYFKSGNFNNCIAQSMSLLWAGDNFNTAYGTITIDAMWFLMALFWVRWYFRGILYLGSFIPKWHDEVILIVCAILSYLALIVHRLVGVVPWGILLGGTALIFYASGWYFNKHTPKWWVAIIALCCWGFALKCGGIDMANYSYNCYALDAIGAIGGTFLIYLISSGICKYTKYISKVLQWFGVNSLLILCVNALDRKSYLVIAIKNLLGMHFDDWHLSVAFHYGIEFLIVIMILYIPFLAKIYKAKKIREI